MEEHKVIVVPNQGKFGVEWMLAHMYLDFVKKVLHVQHKEPGFHAKCFKLWGMLVQSKALTQWSLVIAKHFGTDEKKTEADAFTKSIILYLEALWVSYTLVTKSFTSFTNRRSQP